MTLQQLFRSVEFDALFTYIIKHDPKMKDCEKSFWRAFTTLQSIPNGDDDGKSIMIDYIDDDDPPDASQGIGVWHCADVDWSIALARQIKVFDRLVPMSDDQIAAYCLWEMTCYGFSEAQIERTKEWIDRKSAASQQKWRNLRDEACQKWLFPVIDSYAKRPMNGPKRHRYTRIFKRLIALRNYGHIEMLCDYVDKYCVQGLSHDDLWSYCDAGRVWGYDFPNPKRMSHKELLELDMKLVAETFRETSADKIFILSPAQTYEEEAMELRNYILNNLPRAKVYFGKNLTRGIAVEIVYIHR